jgi:hypothetical protein
MDSCQVFSLWNGSLSRAWAVRRQGVTPKFPGSHWGCHCLLWAPNVGGSRPWSEKAGGRERLEPAAGRS